MCDAIFPDFWVICATDGRTSRVGGGSEREEEEEQGGKSRWRCFHRTHSVVQNFGRKWAKTCENKFQWSFPLVTPTEGWKANLKGSHSGDDRILVIRSRYSHHGSNRLITRAPPAETETAPNKGAFSTASFCRAKIVDISINNTQDQTCPIETIMVSKPPLSLSHPLSLLLPLASIRRSVNTGRGPQTPRCVMVSTPRGLLLATLLVLHQPLRTLSRDQPYQSWLVLFETSSYFNADNKKLQIQQLHITMLVNVKGASPFDVCSYLCWWQWIVLVSYFPSASGLLPLLPFPSTSVLHIYRPTLTKDSICDTKWRILDEQQSDNRPARHPIFFPSTFLSDFLLYYCWFNYIFCFEYTFPLCICAEICIPTQHHIFVKLNIWRILAHPHAKTKIMDCWKKNNICQVIKYI